MQSGKFQHLISLQQKLQDQDGKGNLEDDWQPIPGMTRIMGEVLPDRASEFFSSRQVQATQNALIRMYYQPTIAVGMRVVHHVRPGVDQYWDIQGAVPFQMRQRELRLYCLWREAEGYRRGTDLENDDA